MWPLFVFGAALGGLWWLKRKHEQEAGSGGSSAGAFDPSLPGNTIYTPGPGGAARWKSIKEGKTGDQTYWQLWALPQVFGNATELFVLRYVDTPQGRFFGGVGGDAKQAVVDTGMKEFSINPNFPPGSVV